MSKFKEQLEKDNTQVFINIEEMADYHKINGEDKKCILDEVQRNKTGAGKSSRDTRQKAYQTMTHLLFITLQELGFLPEVRRSIEIDGSSYEITEVEIWNNMAEITLVRRGSYGNRHGYHYGRESVDGD